jgi:4-amino-4-deoxy-L-arabinose transferase-like glycosyltransferase
VTKRNPSAANRFLSNRVALLWCVALVSLAMRAWYLSLFSDSILRAGIWSDAATYNQWARRIVVNGDWLGSDPFFMAPLYPYFLAIIYSVFGESLLAVRLIQSLLGSGTAVLVFLISERVFSSKKAGLVAGLLAAFYGPFLLSHNLLLVETLKVFLVTLAAWFFLIAKDDHRMRWWIGGGLAIGGAVLCRASDFLLLLAVELWIIFFTGGDVRKRALRAVAVAASVALLVLPVTVRNYVVSGEFILITSNGGLNFYLGNNPEAVGRYYNVDRLDLANDPDGRVYLEQTLNRQLRHSEVSGIWFSRAMDFIVQQPGSFLRLLLRKLSLFFHHKEISQIGYNYAFVAQAATGLLTYLPTFLIVGPLGILGAVLSFRRWKDRFLVYSFLVAETLSVVLFFVTDRFRLSAIPFFMAFAGWAVVFLIDQARAKEKKALVAPVLIVVACVVFMTSLTERIPDEFSLEWEQVGTLYFNTGNHTAAMQSYRNAAMYRDAYHLRNAVGNVLLSTGRIDEAIEQYRAGHSMHPGQAGSMFGIGTAYVRRQDWQAALKAFDDAIRINPRFAPAHLNRGLTLYYLQRFGEALASLRRYTELETDQSKLATVHKDIRNLEYLLQAGKTDSLQR